MALGRRGCPGSIASLTDKGNRGLWQPAVAVTTQEEWGKLPWNDKEAILFVVKKKKRFKLIFKLLVLVRDETARDPLLHVHNPHKSMAFIWLLLLISLIFYLPSFFWPPGYYKHMEWLVNINPKRATCSHACKVNHYPLKNVLIVKAWSSRLLWPYHWPCRSGSLL